MSSELAGEIAERAARRPRASGRGGRALAVQVLGPLTMLAGVVWAFAQPYRIVFLHPEGKGAYDFLVQPPLLVVVVGLLFSVLIAPGLVEDLERGDRGPAR
ncbi:MAG TPA: hypothetical protein VNJ46_02465 [Gaiellaceae bacterium]|nr:hypothetical protein [Gaiellaceae bacterium]